MDKEYLDRLLKKTLPQELFVMENGEPMKFCTKIADSKEKNEVLSLLRKLVETCGGNLLSNINAQGPHLIRVLMKGEKAVSTTEDYFKAEFLVKCVEKEKLLDLHNYRANRSRYTDEIDVNEILWGNKSWADVKVANNHEVSDDELFTDGELQKPSKNQLKKTRRPYTRAEETTLLQYILKYKLYTQLKGNTLWMKIEKKKICPGRTWQSLKERFIKKIIPNLNTFKLSSKDYNNVINGFENKFLLLGEGENDDFDQHNKANSDGLNKELSDDSNKHDNEKESGGFNEEDKQENDHSGEEDSDGVNEVNKQEVVPQSNKKEAVPKNNESPESNANKPTNTVFKEPDISQNATDDLNTSEIFPSPCKSVSPLRRSNRNKGSPMGTSGESDFSPVIPLSINKLAAVSSKSSEDDKKSHKSPARCITRSQSISPSKSATPRQSPRLNLRDRNCSTDSSYDSALSDCSVVKVSDKNISKKVISELNSPQSHKSNAFVKFCPPTPKTPVKNQRQQSGDENSEDELSNDDQLPNLSKTQHEKKKPYTIAEETDLLQYILKHKLYKQLKGNTIWVKIEKQKICPGRPWQSLKERFNKKIIPNLKAFKLNSEDYKSVINGFEKKYILLDDADDFDEQKNKEDSDFSNEENNKEHNDHSEEENSDGVNKENSLEESEEVVKKETVPQNNESTPKSNTNKPTDKILKEWDIDQTDEDGLNTSEILPSPCKSISPLRRSNRKKSRAMSEESDSSLETPLLGRRLPVVSSKSSEDDKKSQKSPAHRITRIQSRSPSKSKTHRQSLRSNFSDRNRSTDSSNDSDVENHCNKSKSKKLKRKVKSPQSRVSNAFLKLRDPSPKTPVTKRQRRLPFRVDEDEAIMQCLYDHCGRDLIKGRQIWQILEKNNILKGRTWQSLKERYIKRIKPNLNKYKTNPKLAHYVTYLKKGHRQDDASITWNRNYQYSEDEEILKFIVNNRRYYDIKGRAMWIGLERCFSTNRSWHSLKERFLKIIRYQLNSYPILTREQKLLLRPKKWQNNFMKDSDSCNDASMQSDQEGVQDLSSVIKRSKITNEYNTPHNDETSTPLKSTRKMVRHELPLKTDSEDSDLESFRKPKNSPLRRSASKRSHKTTSESETEVPNSSKVSPIGGKQNPKKISSPRKTLPRVANGGSQISDSFSILSESEKETKCSPSEKLTKTCDVNTSDSDSDLPSLRINNSKTAKLKDLTKRKPLYNLPNIFQDTPFENRNHLVPLIPRLRENHNSDVENVAISKTDINSDTFTNHSNEKDCVVNDSKNTSSDNEDLSLHSSSSEDGYSRTAVTRRVRATRRKKSDLS